MGESVIRNLIGNQPRAMEQPEDPVFGLRQEAGYTIMLDLQLYNGRCVALPYAYLTSINFDRTSGLKLKYTTHEVTITGRNLDSIYSGLRYHRVEFLKEGNERYDERPEAEPFIVRMEVRELV